ncbi:MAG: hypothetical protein IJW18_05405 [Lachnospiraceae bacterium]|nr:hypothetical protein [Lachnospiraceae bacterium]
MNWYELLPVLLNMSITASVIIVTVLILRLFLKRTPKVYSYMLWAVVLFRLLCPVSINTPLSVLGLFDTPVTETADSMSKVVYIPDNIVRTDNQEDALQVPILDDVVNDSVYQETGQIVSDSLEMPISIATYIWIAGIVVMIGISTISYVKLRKSLVGAVQVRDNIYMADYITTPFVLGMFRPRIYLLSSLREQEQQYILKHEQYHIRRGDHIFKFLAYVALCIHWFNPLVWVAFLLFSKDMEMSCDEAVIRNIGEDVRADYSASLLKVATSNTIMFGMPLAFGEVDTKGRIKNLATWKQPGFLVTIGAILICIVGIIICVTNPKKGDYFASEPFGHSYRVAEIIYNAPWYSFSYTPETAPRYQFTSDYTMLVSGDVLDDKGSTEWVQQSGRFEEVEITTENFDKYFDMSGFTISDDAWSELRSSIEKAWRINVENSENNVVYYLLQTKDGGVYLTYEYDVDIDTEVLEEGAHIRWLFGLERIDSLRNNGISEGEVIIEDSETQEVENIVDEPTTEQTPTEQTLDSAILDAIVDRQASAYPDGLYHCASFVELHREEICGVPLLDEEASKTMIMVYGMALEQSFSCFEGKLNRVAGGHMPVVITFEMLDNTYKLSDFWAPRDGSYYASDIRGKFPDEIEEEALDTQKYVVYQMQECYSRATRYFKIDTENVIDGLFDTIKSSPITSSNPADYIDEHPLEYRELIYYGSYSLKYVFSKFIEGGQNGLHGQLMRILLDELAPEASLKLYAETGQEYFDEWAESAVQVLKQHDMEWIKENQPSMWIYLQSIT